jgi:NDP-sugar pyrophosphorylase family protein
VQIVIPMSGFGERFRRAGYLTPKPLVEIEGKPIVAHVLDMFPGESNFFFICNQEHLDEPTFQMAAILKSYCPSGQVVGIAPHKLGPIHAVLQVAHLLDLSKPVVVNYCDFTCYWDWNNFKRYVRDLDCAGAIPAYKGFHPHTLGNTNYAYIREFNGWVADIREKQSFTDNRMEEFASSGTYYFSSARLMLEAFRRTIEEEWQVGGEYYVSLSYKALIANNKPVAVYPLQHFMQWGTPEDVSEYEVWSTAFKAFVTNKKNCDEKPRGALVIPMAGLGKRFLDDSYETPKPMIPVSGRPMVAQAARHLPLAEHHVFVLRTDMKGYQDVALELKSLYPNAIIKGVEQVTQGQACSALIGLEALHDRNSQSLAPITIGACDFGALYDFAALDVLINDPSVDIIVWGVRGYPNARRFPNMFGWIDEQNGCIRSISVKTPLANPAADPIVLGTFTFKDQKSFHDAFNRLMTRSGTVNGEFYIDSLINDAIALGLRCQLFEVSSYLCWGTPNDLRTFEYWQSCFHKWDSHPYRLEADPRVCESDLEGLRVRYEKLQPPRPGSR